MDHPVIDGLRAKSSDIPDPDEAENKRTVVVIAACGTLPLPQKQFEQAPG